MSVQSVQSVQGGQEPNYLPTRYGGIHWGLLKCNPQSQKRYLDNVSEFVPDAELYYPRYEHVSRPHGVRKPLKEMKPVYPGYIFSKGIVPQLTGLPVRARYVRFGKSRLIEEVPNSVIMNLRFMEQSGRLVQEVVHVNPFRPGVRVRVHMPVADLLAVIVRMVGDSRVEVDNGVWKIKVQVHRLEVL